MFKSALLAGFFWATTNFMPASPVAAPMQVAAVKSPTATAVRFVQAMPLKMELPVSQDSTAAVLPAERPAENNVDQTQQEIQEFVARINRERTSRGFSALTLDPMLTQTAHAHSEEMASQAYFDHRSPTPGLTTPMDRYLSSLREMGIAQPDYLLVGENIYYCSVFNDVYNIDYAHRALMNSPGHRANILEPRFTKIGIGVYCNPQGEFWVTEMFSRDTNP